MRVSLVTNGEVGIYHVTLTPNWFEKLFGVQIKTIKLKRTNSYYSFGGTRIYLYPDGTKTGNGDYIAEAVDKFRNKY